MIRPILAAASALSLLTACTATAPADGAASAASAMPPPMAINYAAILADPTRPDADRERDAARMPARLMDFARIARGERVGDYVMGGGYLTRILSGVVGAEGRVYAFQPQEFIAFRAQYGEDQKRVVDAYANVDAVNGAFAAPPFPEPLDTIITVQNFHDLYLKPFPAGTGDRASAALFAALKPGGTLVVVDHSAADGSGTTLADSLHRIDKAAVIAALTQAGFILEAESDLYARPEDPRTANVFDAAIRGKTDQFALRFRKPGQA
jgi:predicted methyltransferase